MVKRDNENLVKNVDILDVDKNILDTLKNNEIITVGSLWEKNRKALKEIGLKDNEIKQITIQLQLLGLDLNKRVYK